MNCFKEVIEEKGIKQTWLSGKLGKSCPIINDFSLKKNQARLKSYLLLATLLEIDPKNRINSNRN